MEAAWKAEYSIEMALEAVEKVTDWEKKVGLWIKMVGKPVPFGGDFWTPERGWHHVEAFTLAAVKMAFLKRKAKKRGVPWKIALGFGWSKGERLLVWLKSHYPQIEWDDGNPVWAPDGIDLYAIYKAVGFRWGHFLGVLNIYLRWVTDPWLSGVWSSNRGVHWGEAFRGLMPAKSVLRKPEALKRWLRGRKAFLQGAVLAFDGERAFYGRLHRADLVRLGRLSPYWRYMATRWCIEGGEWGEGDKPSPMRVDWFKLAGLMKMPPQELGKYEASLPGYIRREAAWKRSFGRAPKRKGVFWGVPEELIGELKKVWRPFRQLIALLPEEELDRRESHAIQAAAKIAVTFGPQWNAWVSPKADAVAIHERGIELHPPYSKELIDFLLRHRDYARRAIMVANSWEGIIQLGGNTAMPLAVLEGLARSLNYQGVQDVGFAVEAARWGVPQREFQRYQERWLMADRVSDIPFVEVDEGEYRMYRLAKDDPRGLFLGHYTNCCQHPGGAGSSCAWHGVEERSGAFFIVEHRGQILAQSWAWRQGNILVFDNVEAVTRAPKEVIKRLYLAAASELVKNDGIQEVRVGAGYSDMELSDLVKVQPVPTPSNCYTDAGVQYLLAKGGLVK